MSFRKGAKKKAGKSKHWSEDLDSQFDAFLKESVSSEESSMDTARVSKYLNKKKQEPPQWWAREDDEDEDSMEIGLTGTGKNFLKKKTAPQPAPTKTKDEPKRVQFSDSASKDLAISRDSLDEESLLDRGNSRPNMGISVPALSLGSTTDTMTVTADKTRDDSYAPGRDTLEELADKERFFNELEKNSDNTVDYSRLNKEIDNSATMGTTTKRFQKSFDEEDEEDEDVVDDVTARKVPQNDDNEQNGLLEKVALLDSLDSTMGTKPAGSRDTDMEPIPEGTREEGSREEDGVDGHRQDEPTETEGTHGADTTNKGLKSATGGFMYTDTSREMEALHNALRQVGLSTMDDAKNYTLKDSSTINERSPEGTGETGTQNTAGFGLKGVAPHSTTSKDRTIDDLLRDMEEMKPTKSDSESRGFDLQPAIMEDDQEERGFDLQPAHPSTINGILESQDNEREGYDLSPEDEFAPPVTESRGFDLSPATPKHSSETTDGVIPVPARRVKKPSESSEYKQKSDKFKHVRGSGYGQKSSFKPKSSGSKDTWSPAEIQKQKIKGTGELQKGKKSKNTAPSIEDSHLLSSVQSFANYIQSQFITEEEPTPARKTKSSPALNWSQDEPALSSSQRLGILEREKRLVKEVNEWQEQWREEKRKLAKAQAECSNIEREYATKFEELKLDYDQQIFKLKQENYVLSAKVTNAEEEKSQRKRILEGATADDVSREQFEMLEREVKEQEKLLAGYQQENERLYQEMKKAQTDSKSTEERLFRENQKLQADVSSLREQLSQKEIQYQNKGAITSLEVQQQIAAGNVGGTAVLGAGKIAHLEAELKQARNREFGFKQDVDMLLKDKKELEKHVEDLVKKLEETGRKLTEATSGQCHEMKQLEVKHEKEIEKLNRKLKWYAENQELLDKDAGKMKDKQDEINKLKARLDNLNSETGRKQAEAKTRQRERAADARKIQDLERQVKEMEGIMRKRHPNSLPVLMWAASSAPDLQTTSPSVQFLENRIKKLEAELEEKDEEGKRSIRVLEQKYNTMKFQYEERIEGLETRLATLVRTDDRNLKEGEHPHTHQVALQRELDSVRERHKLRLAEMEGELEKTRKELSTLKAKESGPKGSDSKTQDESKELNLRIKALQLEIKNQERDKDLLNKTIERLQKDKQQLMVDLSRQSGKTAKAKADTNKKMLNGHKTFIKGRPGNRSSPRDLDEPELPVYTDQPIRSKEYQPDTFAGQHVSDILRENDQLKVTLDRIQLDSEHQRVQIHKLMAETEGRERRYREDAEERVTAIRAAHQEELQRIMAEHALQHSTSRVAQLQSQLDTQEVMIKHLKEQASQAQVDKERLSVLTVREAGLETKVKQLADDLTEARKSHSPEMRHFEGLLTKIKEMETRHARREQDLQAIIQQGRAAATAELSQEVERWRRIVDTKNRETEKFRAELDAILEVLKELQRQGVILPCRGAGVSHR